MQYAWFGERTRPIDYVVSGALGKRNIFGDNTGVDNGLRGLGHNGVRRERIFLYDASPQSTTTSWLAFLEYVSDIMWVFLGDTPKIVHCN